MSVIGRRLTLLAAVLIACLAIGAPQLVFAPAQAAECAGDECEAPPPAPEDPTPGTATVEAPGNPPVHYPKVRCPHGKHRIVNHGASECVPDKPKPHHHHRNHHRGGHR